MTEIAQRERHGRREAGDKSRSTAASTVALREGRGNHEDLTPELEEAFERIGLIGESAKTAARGRVPVRDPASLVEAFKASGMSDASARVAAQGRHSLREVVKNVAGLPASCFAWVQDPSEPSTWRLQISRSADSGNGEWVPDEDLVRAAVAQLPGIAGYDSALEIPASDLPGVKSILRSAWIAANLPIDDMPRELNQEALRRAFLGMGLSEQAAAVAAKGRS
jgi:hypothetical protein